MWPTRVPLIQSLEDKLKDFAKQARPLPGIVTKATRETLALQMVASLRRLDYTAHLLHRDISPLRADPNDILFDPERAAILLHRNGDFDEAVWITFLSIHFGKHRRYGWQRLRDVYSGLGKKTWTWPKVSGDVLPFRNWLEDNEEKIGGAFGNHRKYVSLSGLSSNGTGAAIASYVEWIGPGHSHSKQFAHLVKESGNDPEVIFDHFYNSMHVKQFGRLGKFDFLALLGRLKLAPIVPGKAYLKGATGPLAGARLLFGGKDDATLSESKLEGYIAELDRVLAIGKQAMEDSLCNWQKSPTKFVHFTG